MPFPALVLASASIAVLTLAGTARLARSRWVALIAFGGAAALVLLIGLGYFRFYFDDAFISLRYAQHLAGGLGPNWNSEGRVEGYTNFLWMAILAGLGRLGFDLVEASRALGFVSVLAAFFFAYRIWKLWSDEAPDSGIGHPLVPAIVIVGLALTDGVAFWGISGSETPLFSALLIGGAYLYFREQRDARLPWSAAAFAAAAMTRPEGLIAAAVTGAFIGSAALRRKDAAEALRRFVSWGAAFLLLYGTYFVWRYDYYGYLFPNTFYAKVGPTSAVFDRGLEYVWTWGLRYHLIVMLAGTAALFTISRLRRDALYMVALSGAMLTGIALEGGDDFPHGRFIVPLLPLLYLGGVGGFAVLLKRLELSPARAAIAVTLVLGLGGLSLLRSTQDSFVAREADARHERLLLATWLKEETPEDFTIAAFAVGAIGYYSGRDVLDMLGLNDVIIAHTDIPNLGTGLAGHEKYNIDYVLDDVRPEIILPSDADFRPLDEEELRGVLNVPSPVPARDRLFGDERLWRLYDVRSVKIEGTWFNFLQRADTVEELQAPGLR